MAGCGRDPGRGIGALVESVLRELEFPATDPDLRAELEQQAEALGSDALWRRLAEADPAAAGRIHSANLRKVVRALEVVTLTGRPFAASLPDAAPLWRPARCASSSRWRTSRWRERLALRARRMWGEEGLLDEVRALLPQGLADGQTASRAIGYAQAIAVLGGRMSVEEGLAETDRAHLASGPPPAGLVRPRRGGDRRRRRRPGPDGGAVLRRPRRGRAA